MFICGKLIDLYNYESYNLDFIRPIIVSIAQTAKMLVINY